MHKIKVTEPWGNWHEQPVSVIVQNECNHADQNTYWVDRDGEDYEVKPHDSVWVSDEIECAKCGARWDKNEESWYLERFDWDKTIKTIRNTNKYFSDFQDGRYER